MSRRSLPTFAMPSAKCLGTPSRPASSAPATAAGGKLLFSQLFRNSLAFRRAEPLIAAQLTLADCNTEHEYALREGVV